MIDFKLLESGDLDITGDLQLIDKGAEVAQNCSIRLKTILAEWHQDVSLGMDLEELFAVSTSNAHKEAMLRAVVYSTPGVSKIHKFDLIYSKQDMRLYVDMVVSTIYAENKLITVMI
jgi:hypothetical protein